MDLKDLLGGGAGGMSDPVSGTAQVISASMNPGRGVLQACTMRLVVQADGVPPTAVAYSGLVHPDRWPQPGMVLPVTVDREDPQRIDIEWDDVPSSAERSRQSAEHLAAARRGQGGPVGGARVVDLSGRDLSQIPDEQKAKLRMLGIDPDALDVQRAASVPPPSPASRPDEPGDRLERLERLARLRERGALTDEEFQSEKRRILE